MAIKVEDFKNKTETTTAFNKVWEAEYNLMASGLIDYYNKLNGTEAFKNIAYDGKVFEFADILDRRFFENINRVFESYLNLGTYEAIIGICQGILGEQVEVMFGGEAGEIITINSSASLTFNIATTNGEQIITPQGDKMVAINNRLQYQLNKLEQVIRLFLPAGVEYVFNIGNPVLNFNN